MKAASRAYLRHHSYVCYAAVHSFDVVHMINFFGSLDCCRIVVKIAYGIIPLENTNIRTVVYVKLHTELFS